MASLPMAAHRLVPIATVKVSPIWAIRAAPSHLNLTACSVKIPPPRLPNGIRHVCPVTVVKIALIGKAVNMSAMMSLVVHVTRFITPMTRYAKNLLRQKFVTPATKSSALTATKCLTILSVKAKWSVLIATICTVLPVLSC